MYIFKKVLVLIVLVNAFFLISCDQTKTNNKINNVGLLLSGTINDQVWGTKGYKGLLNIQSTYDVEVYYKESIDSATVAERAVEEFKDKGINLIFGHGSEFAEYFNVISTQYPSIHFVSFNGNAKNENTTSVSFKGYEMGYFGGMVAGHMTTTNNIGIIGAFPSQPEIQGFKDGVAYENKKAVVHTEFVNDWDDREKALALMEKVIKKDVDIVYPAGDGFNVDIIEMMKARGQYVIGYVSDQSDFGKMTVLTSTIQHVPALYNKLAADFNQGNLPSGDLSYGMKEDVISLGKFSPKVDEDFIKRIQEDIEHFKETGKLPN